MQNQFDYIKIGLRPGRRCSHRMPALLAALLLVLSIAVSPARITNLRYSHGVPASLLNGESLSITFDYVTETAGGERIFIRPLTAGRLSANYAASGSVLYTGSGTDTVTLTITSGNVKVDRLRIRIYNADQSQLVHAADVPVEFWFGDAGVNVTSPSAGAQGPLLFNDQVNIAFNYNVGVAGGVRVFIRPFSGSGLSPNYAASGSGLYTGTGTTTAQFTILPGTPTKVDSLRVQTYNADQSQLLTEYFIPVEYYFGTTRISNVAQSPSPAHITTPGTDVTYSFQYATTEAAGVLIFLRPVVNGALMASYGASGSPTYTGSGNGSGSFTKTLFDLPEVVDHVRVQILNPAQTVTNVEYYMPLPTADVSFGTTYLSNIRLFPGPRATLDDEQVIFADFDYQTAAAGQVLIFARPFTAGNLSPNYAAHPSPYYPTGSGQGSGYFTITGGDVTVDQIRFEVWTSDFSQKLMSFFVPVEYIFQGPPTLQAQRVTGGIQISWGSHLGKQYQLTWSPSLSPAVWNNLGLPQIGTGGVMSFLDSDALSGAKFYRMVVSD